MIEQFKTLMREHFPERNLNMLNDDDESFKDPIVDAMWVMYQICNSWEKPKKVNSIDDREKVLVVTKIGSIMISPKWMTNDETYGCKVWKRIPPLTTEGGV